MPIVVECPSCSRKVRVPEELLGRKVKCPSCQGTFTATDSSAPAEAPPPAVETMVPPSRAGRSPVKGSEISAQGPPPEAPDEPAGEFDTCVSCGERIAKDSERCKYCGQYQFDQDQEPAEDDEPEDRPRRRRRKRRRRSADYRPHRGAIILVLGILSTVFSVFGLIPCCFPLFQISGAIAIGLGIPAWIMGQKDRRLMRAGEMDPSGSGMATGGWICGIVGTAIGGIDLVCCVVGLIIYGVSLAAQPGSSSSFGPPPSAPPRRFSVDDVAPQLRDYLPRLSQPGQAPWDR